MIATKLRSLAVDIGKVSPDPGNPNEHDQQSIDMIAASLQKFGQDQPCVARKSGVLIKGEGRYRAAVKLGWTKIAVVFVDEDEADSIARGIADNAAADYSYLDPDKLTSQLGEIDTGFENADLRRMFAELEPDVIADDDGEAPDLSTLLSGKQTVADMELRPEEHYDFVVLLADNVNDWNRLCALLELPDIHSERTGRRVGMGRAARVSRVLELIDGRHSDRDPVEGSSGEHEDGSEPVSDGADSGPQK